MVVLIATAAFWLVDLGLLRAGVPDPLDDTWEYGVAARHLLAGHGFRTSVIHPALWSLRDSSITVPILIHGPLMPLITAAWIRIGGDAALDRMALLAALFATVTAWVIYRLGERHGGRWIGAAAAALFTLSPLTLDAVHHDVSPLLGALLLGLAIDALARPRPRALAGGLLLALATLTRPELLIALPLGAWACPRERRGWFVAAVTLVAAPWWWHNLRASGSPFFNLSSYLVIGYRPGAPEMSPLRDFALSPASWPSALQRALPDLPAKWVGTVPRAARWMLATPGLAVGWLAAIGAAAMLAASPSRARTWSGIVLALVPLAVMTLTVPASRYMVPFLPLWCLAAAIGARALAVRWRPQASPEWWWVALAIALIVPESVIALSGAQRTAETLRSRLGSERRLMRRALATPPTPDAIVFSDTPDFVAWTVRRPAVWLTAAEHERLPAAGARDGPVPVRDESTDPWFHVGMDARAPVSGPVR